MLNAMQVILICLVTQAAMTDLTLRKIPNALILSGLLLALLLHLLGGQHWAPLTHWLAGSLAGLFLFLPLYAARAMAGGDVKLMAMVGAFLGPLAVLQVAVLAVLSGGVLALLMLWHSGQWRALLASCLGRPRPSPRTALLLRSSFSRAGSLPYGVAIALGTLVFVALAHR